MSDVNAPHPGEAPENAAVLPAAPPPAETPEVHAAGPQEVSAGRPVLIC